MTKPTRPLLRYLGGKWKIAPFILQHLPRHRIYVEPFGGAGSILLLKPRVQTEIYNDIDAGVVNLFRVCRSHPEELANALLLTPYSRDEYASLYEPTSEPIEAARRFVARSFMGQNSKGAHRRSGFDGRMNDDYFVSRLASLVALPDVVKEVAARLTSVLIENTQAVPLMKRYDSEDTLHYLDPPYVPSTRGKERYPNDLTGRQHQQLLAAAKKLKGMVALSGYHTPLYDRALRAWTRRELPTNIDGGHQRIEVLWLNPACVAALDRERLPLFAGAADG